jgi:hypothetical protein
MILLKEAEQRVYRHSGLPIGSIKCHDVVIDDRGTTIRTV